MTCQKFKKSIKECASRCHSESTSSLELLLLLMNHFGACSSNITCLFKGLTQLQNVTKENPKVSGKDLWLIQGSKQQFGD